MPDHVEGVAIDERVRRGGRSRERRRTCPRTGALAPSFISSVALAFHRGIPAEMITDSMAAQQEGVWGGYRNRAQGIRCNSDQAVQDGSRTSLRPSNTCIPRRIRRTGSFHRGKCSRHRDRRSARLVVQKAARACMPRRDGRSAALHDSCRRRDRTAPTRTHCPLCIHRCSLNIPCARGRRCRGYRIPGSNPYRCCSIGWCWKPGRNRCLLGQGRVGKRVLGDRRRPPRGAGSGAEREGFYRGNQD